jgi:hypothetical protein
LDYTISVSFRVGSLEPLPCRGHLTPTEGRGGAETLGEGRPGRAVHEKSKGEHCDLQATASTRRLNRRNAARQMRRASVVARKRSNASTAIFRLNPSKSRFFSKEKHRDKIARHAVDFPLILMLQFMP